MVHRVLNHLKLDEGEELDVVLNLTKVNHEFDLKDQLVVSFSSRRGKLATSVGS